MSDEPGSPFVADTPAERWQRQRDLLQERYKDMPTNQLPAELAGTAQKGWQQMTGPIPLAKGAPLAWGNLLSGLLRHSSRRAFGLPDEKP